MCELKGFYGSRIQGLRSGVQSFRIEEPGGLEFNVGSLHGSF